MRPINFSIIIPWCGGDKNRETSLYNMLNCLTVQITRNLDDPIVYEVLIVEQVTKENKEERAREIREIVPEAIQNYRYIQLVQDTPFNKSWCMNVGARESNNQHLLFMDADSLFGNDYFLTMKAQIRKTPSPHNKIMFCWNYIICLPGKDNPISRHIRPDTTFAMGGIWYVDKYFYFNQLGGMNENYFGYGGEDNDAYERAIFINRTPSVSYIPYTLAHQYHDWAKPSEHSVKYFEITKKHPNIIIQRLKEINIGQRKAPSLIEMEDLL